MECECSEEPRKVRIVAMCGPRRSGKDEAARVLSDAMGYRVERFAAPLKAVVGELFGFSDDDLEGPAKDAVHPAWGVSPRRVMQFFGTEVMQHKLQELLPGIGRRFFAERLAERCSGALPYVVADMRFPHEAQVLRDRFGDDAVLVVRVVRSHRQLVADDDHCSEREHAGIAVDVEIVNDGTIEQLRHAVIRAVAGDESGLRRRRLVVPTTTTTEKTEEARQ